MHQNLFPVLTPLPLPLFSLVLQQQHGWQKEESKKTHWAAGACPRAKELLFPYHEEISVIAAPITGCRVCSTGIAPSVGVGGGIVRIRDLIRFPLTAR